MLPRRRGDSPCDWEFGAELTRFSTVHKEFFPTGYPAWSAVGTTALLSPGAVVEMRVMAVRGAGAQLQIERGAR